MRTDFYLLSTDSLANRDLFVCRLIEKAYFAGNSLYIATESDEHANRLDALLWQFRADSFVPHELKQDPECTLQSPIIIGPLELADPASIWLNLTQQPAKEPLACQRLIEVVPKDPSFEAKARERFRHYRELGYTLHTHHVN